MLPAFCIKQFRQVMLCLFWIMRPKLGETKRNKKKPFSAIQGQNCKLKTCHYSAVSVIGGGHIKQIAI